MYPVLQRKEKTVKLSADDYIGNQQKVICPVRAQMGILAEDEFGEVLDLDSDTGYKNEMVELSDEQLLKNIQQLQNENNIKMSTSLVKDLGR